MTTVIVILLAVVVLLIATLIASTAINAGRAADYLRDTHYLTRRILDELSGDWRLKVNIVPGDKRGYEITRVEDDGVTYLEESDDRAES